MLQKLNLTGTKKKINIPHCCLKKLLLSSLLFKTKIIKIPNQNPMAICSALWHILSGLLMFCILKKFIIHIGPVCFSI